MSVLQSVKRLGYSPLGIARAFSSKTNTGKSDADSWFSNAASIAGGGIVPVLANKGLEFVRFVRENAAFRNATYQAINNPNTILKESHRSVPLLESRKPDAVELTDKMKYVAFPDDSEEEKFLSLYVGGINGIGKSILLRNVAHDINANEAIKMSCIYIRCDKNVLRFLNNVITALGLADILVEKGGYPIDLNFGSVMSLLEHRAMDVYKETKKNIFIIFDDVSHRLSYLEDLESFTRQVSENEGVSVGLTATDGTVLLHLRQFTERRCEKITAMPFNEQQLSEYLAKRVTKADEFATELYNNFTPNLFDVNRAVYHANGDLDTLKKYIEKQTAQMADDLEELCRVGCGNKSKAETMKALKKLLEDVGSDAFHIEQWGDAMEVPGLSIADPTSFGYQMLLDNRMMHKPETQQFQFVDAMVRNAINELK